MRSILLPLLFVVLGAAPAWAQQAARFEVGPTIRADRLFVEGDGGGLTTVTGAVAAWHFTGRYGVEAEVTTSSSRVERSYQGWFVSYAAPSASRAEIERLAPIARRTVGYEPGLGGAVAFVARGRLGPRVSLTGRVGVSARQYVETSEFTVLQIPEGVDPARVARDHANSSADRNRGGLLLGLDVPLRLTARLQLAPEVRYVHGGPARVGHRHREFGVGIRAAWTL